MKMTNEEFKAQAKEVIETCNKYGFMQNKIMPYGFGMTVAELVKNWKDYDNYTYSSRELMQAELLGFLPILEHWVKLENEPKVTVKFTNNVIKEVSESIAKDFIELGCAVMVKEA